MAGSPAVVPPCCKCTLGACEERVVLVADGVDVRKGRLLQQIASAMVVNDLRWDECRARAGEGGGGESISLYNMPALNHARLST